MARALEDERYDERVDAAWLQVAATKPTSALCVPIQDGDDRVVAVLTVVCCANDADAPASFGPEAESLMRAFGAHLRSAIAGVRQANSSVSVVEQATGDLATLQKQLQDAKIGLELHAGGAGERAEFLQSFSALLLSNLELKTLFAVLVDLMRRALSADRATLFLVDQRSHELWTVVAHGLGELRVPLGAGLAGDAAVSGRVVNVADAYQDSRFDAAFDLSSGYVTQRLVAAE